jgi:hypothetical protein
MREGKQRTDDSPFVVRNLSLLCLLFIQLYIETCKAAQVVMAVLVVATPNPGTLLPTPARLSIAAVQAGSLLAAAQKRKTNNIHRDRKWKKQKEIRSRQPTCPFGSNLWASTSQWLDRTSTVVWEKKRMLGKMRCEDASVVCMLFVQQNWLSYPNGGGGVINEDLILIDLEK